jgi:ArsR family transcriptional regulator
MLVRAGPAGSPAGKLGEPLKIAPNAMTFHLQKLAHVGLITSRRQGQWIIYSAVFSDLLELSDNLVGACCANTFEKCGPTCPSTSYGSDGILSIDNANGEDLIIKERGI